MGGSGISWAICKSAPCSGQIIMSAPHPSIFTGLLPLLPPNQQHQSTEGTNDKQCMKNNCMPSLKGNAARQSQYNGNGSRPVSESLQVQLSARGRRPWFPSLWAESGRRFCCRDRRSLEHTADHSPSPAASTLRMHTHTHAGTTERFYRQSCQTGFLKNFCRRNVVGCVKRLIVAIKWFRLFVLNATDKLCLFYFSASCSCCHTTAIQKPHYLLPHSNPGRFYLSGTGLPRLSWKTGR